MARCLPSPVSTAKAKRNRAEERKGEAVKRASETRTIEYPAREKTKCHPRRALAQAGIKLAI